MKGERKRDTDLRGDPFVGESEPKEGKEVEANE